MTASATWLVVARHACTASSMRKHAVGHGKFGVCAQVDEGHRGILDRGSRRLFLASRHARPAYNHAVTSVLNIAAYRFVPKSADLPALRLHTLHAQRAAAGPQRVTVLLAEEGINLFLAGEHRTRCNAWLGGASQPTPRFAGHAGQAKASAPRVPFKRLLVKVKREIIRMNMPAISCGRRSERQPAVEARARCARWLDQGH